MHLGGEGRRFDGGVMPLLEGEDCCSLLGESVCSGCLMMDVADRSGRFDGGVILVFDTGDCCTLFCGPLEGLSTVVCICTGGYTF